MTKESQTSVFITLEEIQILHDALDAQYDSNFESDYEIMREEMNKCDWDYVHDMIVTELTANELFELHKKQFFKSPRSRYRIPFRFNKNDPRKSTLFRLY